MILGIKQNFIHSCVYKYFPINLETTFEEIKKHNKILDQEVYQQIQNIYEYPSLIEGYIKDNTYLRWQLGPK